MIGFRSNLRDRYVAHAPTMPSAQDGVSGARTSPGGEDGNIVGAVLDVLPQAIIVVDADCRALSVNAAARAVIGRRETLLLDGGALICIRRGDTTALRRLVADCAADPDGRQGLLALPCMQGGRPLALRIRRLQAAPAGRDGPAVAIVFADRGRGQAIAAEELRVLYGLTRAEARAALAVQASAGLRDAADQLGVQLATARSQLRQVFQKVGVARQADLVRVICEDLLPL